MVSTVTTTTVTTVAIAGSFALVGVITLLALLIQKEAITNTEGNFAQTLRQALKIGIVPLLIGFILIVAARIFEVFK